MEISVHIGDATSVATEVLVVNLFEGVTAPQGATGTIDRALSGTISWLIAEGELHGKEQEIVIIHTPDHAYPQVAAKRILVAGLGKPENFNYNVVRRVAAAVVNKLIKTGITTASSIVHGAGIGNLGAEEASAALVESTQMGAYRFLKYHTKRDDLPALFTKLTLIEHDGDKRRAIETGATMGKVFAEATNLARDLVNEPANQLPPATMAKHAEKLAERYQLQLKVMELSECEQLEMGAFVGVAKGSAQPSKFVHISYTGNPENPADNIWIIGKSITFDTGGISLKPAPAMGEMKGDMGGGAAVLGAMQAVGELRPRINVHAVCPCAENMPGGNAQRPGDVVKAMNGTWIEVDNTDAEGRLTLADAVCYAKSHNASRIVDIATLTGAMRIALGSGNIGGFSNNDELFTALQQAGQKHGESVWRMPLDRTAQLQNRSNIADIKNTGGRYAGAVTAAHFIGEFVGDTPWVHLDIAGVSMKPGALAQSTKMASGATTRLLARLIMDLAQPD